VNILVTYFSETGNTKKVAEAIDEEARKGDHEVQLLDAGSVNAETLVSADLAFVGSTCHSADIAAPAKAVLGMIPTGSALRLAGFMTHSTLMPGKSDRHTELYEKWAGKAPGTFQAKAKEKGIEFVGYFHCMGAANPGIEEFIRNTIITDEAEWTEYAPEMRKHPDAKDLDDARVFAREVLAKL